ncbi:MAG: 50S ribosomal protein L4 [Candidatus Levybacteria bacterium]|nr:50S ribosomal protein L4 [Candidatus Levybacteria bacterium]
MAVKKIKTQKVKTEAKKTLKTTKKASTKKLNATVSTSSIKVSPRKSTKGLTLDVYDTKGKVAGSIHLPKDIFGAKINNQLMAQAVRVYLANQRSGTASVKTRGEVRGSTRKIYRQKGTGRARHGAIRAPIFVHGGIAFGPRPRDYSLELPKKMKKAALFSALSSKLNDGAIKVVTGLEKIEPKTKQMANIIQNLELDGKNRNILLVLSDAAEKQVKNVYIAARNLEGVDILPVKQLNTYEVLRSDKMLMMQASVDIMQKHFIKEG